MSGRTTVRLPGGVGAGSAARRWLETRDRWLTPRAHGELDLVSNERFGATLHEGADAGALGIVVDLSDVRFIDSSGFSACCPSSGVRLRRGAVLLVATYPSITRMLRTDLMPRSASERDALAALDGDEA